MQVNLLLLVGFGTKLNFFLQKLEMQVNLILLVGFGTKLKYFFSKFSFLVYCTRDAGKSYALGQIWDQIEIFLQHLEKQVNLILLVGFGAEQKYFFKI